MNILFYTNYKVSSTKGGTERTTISVASGLNKYCGCKCYSLYSVEADTAKEDCFEEEIQWKSLGQKGIARLIKEKHIDDIICQGAFGMVKTFKHAVQSTNCKVIFVHHFEPGWEENFFRKERLRSSLQKTTPLRQKLKLTLELMFFPIFRWRYFLHLKHSYRDAYELADKTVLLCKGFIHQYMEYAKITDNSNFHIIPNGLSYDEFLPISDFNKKKKTALIVSRLDDPQKRLSLALKIWNEVKKRAESEGWVLNIVGHGPDKEKYLSMIKELQIPDVFLLGRQQPKAYYKESSIFLMTSKSEGWGLTLTEAQQFGVVPIAFNSYAALEDIMTDGENGIVVPECDISQYIEKLLWLMLDNDRRHSLAENGINSSHRFSQKEIARKWNELFAIIS